MKTAKLKLMLALALLVVSCLASDSAQARTQLAASGRPLWGTDSSCFDANGQPGVINRRCAVDGIGQPVMPSWVMPIAWDNAGVYRTVTLRFKQTAENRLQCAYYGWNSDGTPLTGVQFPYFTASNAWRSASITVTYIAAGSFGEVRCAMSVSDNQGSQGYTAVLGIDYAP